MLNTGSHFAFFLFLSRLTSAGLSDTVRFPIPLFPYFQFSNFQFPYFPFFNTDPSPLKSDFSLACLKTPSLAALTSSIV